MSSYGFQGILKAMEKSEYQGVSWDDFGLDQSYLGTLVQTWEGWVRIGE